MLTFGNMFPCRAARSRPKTLMPLEIRHAAARQRPVATWQRPAGGIPGRRLQRL